MSAQTKSIDWAAIHRRLEDAAGILERKASPASAEKKAILRERARLLAREPKMDDRREERIEIAEFRLAGERYAIETTWVREVYPLKELTPLPGTPSFVTGIINVRGQIVSVVDLKKFFDLPAKGLANLDKVIIVGDGRMEFGLLADAVAGVREIALRDIQGQALPTLTGVRAEYLKGVTADRLAVLDLGKLLADPAMKISQSAQT